MLFRIVKKAPDLFQDVLNVGSADARKRVRMIVEGSRKILVCKDTIANVWNGRGRLDQGSGAFPSSEAQVFYAACV